jgi:hypothetical protein
MSEPRPEAYSTRHPAEIGRFRLWFGILGAPVVWVALGGLGWFFGERICTAMSIGAVRVVLGLLSLAALGTAIAALWIAWDNWQLTNRDQDVMKLEGYDRVEFMAAGGFLVSAVFILAIVWAGLSTVFINVCGGMR